MSINYCTWHTLISYKACILEVATESMLDQRGYFSFFYSFQICDRFNMRDCLINDSSRLPQICRWGPDNNTWMGGLKSAQFWFLLALVVLLALICSFWKFYWEFIKIHIHSPYNSKKCHPEYQSNDFPNMHDDIGESLGLPPPAGSSWGMWSRVSGSTKAPGAICQWSN